MILITGASGLVGNAIFQELIKNNEVIGTSFLCSTDEFRKIDLLDENQVRDFFVKYEFSTIIHCATVIPSKIKNLTDVEQYIQNIKITTNILNHISTQTKFVNISSTAIYNLEGNYSLDELSKIKCDTLYQLSKQHIENLIKTYYMKNKINFLNIRISSPYSMYTESDTILYKFINSANYCDEIILWGSGKRTQAFTNINCFASDLTILLKHNIFGTYNYVNTTKISMKELAYKINFFVNSIEIKYIDKQDPEDNCRTSINIDKLSKVINIKNNIDDDIKYILSTLL